jgi:hypothetical protein
MLHYFHFWIGDGNTSDFELKGSMHSLNLICSYFIHEINFDLLHLFTDRPHFKFATFSKNLGLAAVIISPCFLRTNHEHICGSLCVYF